MIKKHIFLYLICVYNVQKIKYYWSRIELTQYAYNLCVRYTFIFT